VNGFGTIKMELFFLKKLTKNRVNPKGHLTGQTPPSQSSSSSSGKGVLTELFIVVTEPKKALYINL